MLRLLTVLMALVFAWALPGVATAADACPPRTAPSPAPATPGGTTPTPTPPAADTPAPPAPSPTPVAPPPVTPTPGSTPSTPPCDCASLCESRREFKIRLRERGQPITRATVATLVGTYTSAERPVTRTGGRLTGTVSIRGRTVRRGEFFIARITYWRGSEKQHRLPGLPLLP